MRTLIIAAAQAETHNTCALGDYGGKVCGPVTPITFTELAKPHVAPSTPNTLALIVITSLHPLAKKSSPNTPISLT